MHLRSSLSQAETTIRSLVEMLLERRGVKPIDIPPDTRLAEDLEMDSLELAELSAALEDEFGRDPYTEGIVPETLGELVAFYDS